MTRRLALGLPAALLAAIGLGAASRAATKAEPKLAHMVFFTLKDHSKESREAFIALAQKYLSGHDGVASFSVGAIAQDVVEPVSVRDFDVALHIVFNSKEAGAAYLKNPRHDSFVAEGKDTWTKVRVFDSYLATP